MAENFDQQKAKQLKTLIVSYNMHTQTIKDTVDKMEAKKNADGTPVYTDVDIADKLRAIEDSQKDIVTQYQQYGGDMDEFEKETSEFAKSIEESPKKKKKRTSSKPSISIDEVMKEDKPVGKNTNNTGSLKDKLKKYDETFTKAPERTSTKVNAEPDYTSFIPKEHQYDPKEQFDLVSLPSKGECYANKKDKVAVSYLVGYDENVMISPGLYANNTIIDVLLKRKVIDTIDPEDMLDGDRDAIILWLRATGYGVEYPITVQDKETKKEFSSVVDLSTVKFKPFNLKGDENGYFDFTLPVTKDAIKFKFLTHREKATLSRIEKYENNVVLRGEILTMAKTIDNFVNDTKSLDDETEEDLTRAKESLQKAYENIDADETMDFTETLTNKMALNIVSINGNTDRNYIEEYAKNMNVRDSLALRRYIMENEPGVDFHFNVERPESLGGGSMPVFLSINQFIFLNIL